VFAGLMLTRGLFGLTGSASNPAAQAYVADRTTPEERTPALAVMASAFGLGTVLGPPSRPFMALTPLGLIGPIVGFAAIAFVMLAVVNRGWRGAAGAAAGRAVARARRRRGQGDVA
jgi:MFS family permease